MKMKKILAGALIGAFTFGISAGNINTVFAANSKNAVNVEKREPPKDSDGKVMPPPSGEKTSNDKNFNRENPPEPPKDENGNPLPPPDKNDNGKTTLDKNRTAPDNDKTTLDKNRTAPDKGKTTLDKNRTVPDKGKTTLDKNRKATK